MGCFKKVNYHFDAKFIINLPQKVKTVIEVL